MAAVIIRQKDLKRLGKELVKEVFEFLDDEYILKNFEEMKKERQKFLIKLVYNNFSHLELSDEIKNKYPFKIEYIDFDENKFDKEIKRLKEEIKNGTLDTHVIFDVLLYIDLDSEIDGDLYFKTQSFLDIYRVFENGYSYLED